MGRERVDVLLVRRGEFESRSKAAAAIMAGTVLLADGGRRIAKAGQLVDEHAEFRIEGASRFVSRGGEKLANALDALTGPVIQGRRCLDVGASTGGFTDCLLQHGAEHVIAVDVAYGEFHWKLRNDPRVTLIERKNARELKRSDFDHAPDLVVGDLSFISARKVLPALVDVAADDSDILLLVKPQFEVGRERVGKGGVVRDAADRRAAIASVAAAGRELGLSVNGIVSSGLPGPAGNRESFVWFGRGAYAAPVDLDAALGTVEPVG